MPKNQYSAPAMEVVEFGKEDIVCVISGVNTDKWDGSSSGSGDGNPDYGGGWDGSDIES